MKDQDIKNVLNSLSDSIDNDKVELFKKIIGDIDIQEYDNPEDFWFDFMYPYENFIDGLVRTTISTNSDVAFIFKNSQYIDRHFNNLFVDYEGMACCADKSRTILKRLIRFYMTRERIEFDYDAEYTFHLPKTIFKTHEQIVGFYEGLKNLYYGKPQKYLEEMKKLLIDLSVSDKDTEIK